MFPLVLKYFSSDTREIIMLVEKFDEKKVRELVDDKDKLERLIGFGKNSEEFKSARKQLQNIRDESDSVDGVLYMHNTFSLIDK